MRLSVLFRAPGPILGLRSDNRVPSPHHILEGVSENKSLPKVLKVGWCLLGHPNRLPSRPRVYIPICKGLGHGLTESKIFLCLTLRLTPRPRASLVAMGLGDGQAYTTMVSGLLGHLLSLRCSGHFLYHFNMFIYLSFFSFFFFFWSLCSAYGILVPQPGIEPMSPAVQVWSLNHWTLREVPL